MQFIQSVLEPVTVNHKALAQHVASDIGQVNPAGGADDIITDASVL